MLVAKAGCLCSTRERCGEPASPLRVGVSSSVCSLRPHGKLLPAWECGRGIHGLTHTHTHTHTHTRMCRSKHRHGRKGQSHLTEILAVTVVVLLQLCGAFLCLREISRSSQFLGVPSVEQCFAASPCRRSAGTVRERRRDCFLWLRFGKSARHGKGAEWLLVVTSR